MGALIGRQVRYVNDRPDLDRAATGHGNPRRDGDRLVEIARIDQEIAAQLLLGLRERTDGHYPFALAYPDAGRRGGRLERGGGEILARGAELVRQLRGLAVAPLPLALTQGLLVKVDQQHVPHECASIPCYLPLGWVLTPCPPLREVLTPLSPSPRSPHPPVALSEKSSPPCPPLPSGEGGLSASPSPEAWGLPPAIAPTTRKGSVPDATASGSGASGGSWVRSRSHAKNRRNGRRCAVTWSRIVPRSMG